MALMLLFNKDYNHKIINYSKRCAQVLELARHRLRARVNKS